MTPKQRVIAAVEHRKSDQLPVDFGSSFITGIHCSVVESLRDHYELESRPIKVCEPYQMLGEVEADLMDAMGIDVQPIFPNRTLFGFTNRNWKPWQTPWGQEVLVAEDFNTTQQADGSILIYPEGDREARACAMMPRTGYFFDTIERLDPEFDEDNLKLEDNLEEFGLMSESEANYWKRETENKRDCDRAVSVHLNGTCLGDIALVPAPFLKQPKGVRGVADWYMLTAEDPEFVKELFDRQTDIALKNLERLADISGDVIDIVVVCGTDFGTQNSLFCSVPNVRDIWLPRYQRINDWIHQNTKWKTFKHSCGAVEPLIDTFIDAGFDILNPVQCSATGMEADRIKEKYGQRITFWGGGVNTQQTLPFGSAEDVRREVMQRCEVFSKGGGYVFNAIHNVQALTPVENVVAMVEALKEFNGNS